MSKRSSFMLVTLLFNFSGCIADDYKTEKTVSPSTHYYLITTVNRSDNSKNDYADVVINLFDSLGQLKSILNTHAGDANKWAVGWDNQRDTVILFSSDIDNNAWAVQRDSLVPIKMSSYLNNRANELMLLKYNSK